ncbi:MAG: transposase, partial [Pseudomonadota bacterium]
LELMLRMYLCQNCLGLSDEGIEDAIVDSIAVRRFVGIDLIERQPPDATTLLKFRRLLERVGLPASIFALIREHLGQAEHAKASIRAKVEHVFHVVKDLFRHRKCRYKGLAKNTAQLQVLFAMANLVLSQRALRAPYRTVAS